MKWHPAMSHREIEDYYEHDLVGEMCDDDEWPDDEEETRTPERISGAPR